MSNYSRIGVFGTTESGKTTLAKKLALQFWLQRKIRSLVLDPHNESWGEHALVSTDEKAFWETVWKTNGCLIVVDEASTTINRDSELIPLFTKLRHNQHHLIVIGHSGRDLLPSMRQAINMLFLFRQSKKAAEGWAEMFTENGLMESTTLGQYEFIRCGLYQKPQRLKLKL